MRIVVADGFRPFVDERTDGAARRIAEALGEAGHEVETLRLPRGGDVTRTALAARLTDVSDIGEVLVAVGPPAHLLRHPRKLIWCEGSDFAVPSALAESDRSALDEARAVIAASESVRALVTGWWTGEVGLVSETPGDDRATGRRLAEALLA